MARVSVYNTGCQCTRSTSLDDDPDVRSMAANALAGIGPDARDALPFIKMALVKERSGMVAFALKTALTDIGGNQ